MTNYETRKFFLPALSLKIFGAIALGLIYTFYYSGGDTINYFNDAQKIVDGIYKSPWAGLKILFRWDDLSDYNFYQIWSNLWFYKDPTSFVVVQFVTILSFITFRSYGAIAILFAAISFSGIWMMFYSFSLLRNNLYKKFTLSVLFIPSAIFWGSGIMKDTICIAALGWFFYGSYRLVYGQYNLIKTFIILILSAFILTKIKIYILLSFLPSMLYWLFLKRTNFTNSYLKLFLRPFLLLIGIIVSVYSLVYLSSTSKKYNLEEISNTVQITADWLSYVSKIENGSGYSLSSTFDGSLSSLLRLSPEAINVTYFRPYLWEANNPVMFISALESLLILILVIYTLYVFISQGLPFRKIPTYIIPLIIFSILFATAIGISTYNFGSLVRYKIPALPFFISSLLVIIDTAKKKLKISKHSPISILFL